jgi:MerR family transcriptional regulator, mercuric resistance operon regulatory protein
MRKVTVSRSEDLSIGDLSRLTGVNIQTIRYYERVGVLPAVPRKENGRRAFGPRETRTLAFIRRARELGFSLDDIRGMIEIGAPGDAPCVEVRDVAARHIKAIRGKIADLKRLERLLAPAIVKCSGERAPDCPIIDILDVFRPHSSAS